MPSMIEYSLPVRVRNTFIDTSAERSPSLERFYREREVTTCPSAHVGRLRGLWLEAEASAGPELREEAEEELPQQLEARGSPQLPADRGSPAGPQADRAPARVLSLSAALGAPSPLPPQPQLQRPVAWSGATFAEPPPAAFAKPVPTAVAVAPCPAVLVGRPAMLAPVVALGQLGIPAAGNPAARAAGAGLAGAPLPPAGPAEARPPCPPPNRPAPGSEELPSVGSAEHAQRRCKPCAFFHTVGCTSGLACQFCHLCEAGEKKLRRREKLEARRAVRQARFEAKQGLGRVVGDRPLALAA